MKNIKGRNRDSIHDCPPAMGIQGSTYPRFSKDVVAEIASFCSVKKVLVLSKVNKLFNEAVDVNYIWRPLFFRRFEYEPDEIELAQIDVITYSSNSTFKKYYAYKNSYFKCRVVKSESLYDEYNAMFTVDCLNHGLVKNEKFKSTMEWDQIMYTNQCTEEEFWKNHVGSNFNKEVMVNEFTGERFVLLRYNDCFGSIHKEGSVEGVGDLRGSMVMPQRRATTWLDFLSAMEQMYCRILESCDQSDE